MATAIQCELCGFTFGFVEDGVEYVGFVCPSCQVATRRVEVEVDGSGGLPASAGKRWYVVDRFGQAVAGPYRFAGAAISWIVKNEMWDHPRGPVDIAPLEKVAGVASGGSAKIVGPVDYRACEWPGEAAFWTPDRVIMRERLDVILS